MMSNATIYYLKKNLKTAALIDTKQKVSEPTITCFGSFC